MPYVSRFGNCTNRIFFGSGMPDSYPILGMCCYCDDYIINFLFSVWWDDHGLSLHGLHLFLFKHNQGDAHELWLFFLLHLCAMFIFLASLCTKWMGLAAPGRTQGSKFFFWKATFYSSCYFLMLLFIEFLNPLLLCTTLWSAITTILALQTCPHAAG
jgi:hypothetical protein